MSKMRFAVALFLVSTTTPLLVSAFQQKGVTNKIRVSSGTSLYANLSIDANDDGALSRRQMIAAGSSSLAAALVSAGAPPALAEDISAQCAKLGNKYKSTVNTNGAPEKHIPQVTLSKTKDGMDVVKVVVPHVMDAEKPHWIQAIWLKEEDRNRWTEGGNDVAVAKVFPPTDASPPTLTCGIPKGKTLTPYLYCNLHGLWKGESFSV